MADLGALDDTADAFTSGFRPLNARLSSRYLLLDLDNTLYPRDCGLWEAIGHRISLYMIERLGFRPEEVRERRDNYLHVFGTTLNALRHYHDIDPEEFLAFVHDLPLENYLQSDLDLDAMLGRLPHRKVIFTNADSAHAGRVLARLGISRHFERVIDIHALGFVNKPHPKAYEIALEILSAQPPECVFADDTLQNLIPARAMGMTTILVGDTDGAGFVDHQIPSITSLETALGWI